MNNRTIKFRVYDKIQKRMFWPAGNIRAENPGDFNFPALAQEFDTEFANIKGAWGFFPGEYYFSEDFIIQQFTGLLDKNNKEIYEGDLIKFIPRNRASDDMLFEIKYGVYNCPFGEGYADDLEFGFYAETVNKLKHIDSIATSNKIMVIGNIFENPELIK